MIDFDEVVGKFKPGTVVNTVSELAIVIEMWAGTDGLLYTRLLFARNIGRSTDLLIYDQEDAKKYQVDKWQMATVEDFTDELNAITGKNPYLTVINLVDCEQLDDQIINELDINFEQLMEEIKQ